MQTFHYPFFLLALLSLTIYIIKANVCVLVLGSFFLVFAFCLALCVQNLVSSVALWETCLFYVLEKT